MVFVITIIKYLLKRRSKKRLAKQTHDGWYDDNGNYHDSEMSLPKNMTSNDTRHPAKRFAESFLRFFQFVLGLTVAGLYGVDLSNAREKQSYADSRWVYAEVCTALATTTALIYLMASRMIKNGPPLAARVHLHLPLFVWETFLSFLWLVLFGIFGKMYIGENPEGDSGIVRMKHAVWVDLVNLVMWACTAAWCGLRWWMGKGSPPEESAPPLADGEKYPPYPPQPPQPSHPHYQGNVI